MCLTAEDPLLIALAILRGGTVIAAPPADTRRAGGDTLAILAHEDTLDERLHAASQGP